jgi:hypothetical protein
MHRIKISFVKVQILLQLVFQKLFLCGLLHNVFNGFRFREPSPQNKESPNDDPIGKFLENIRRKRGYLKEFLPHFETVIRKNMNFLVLYFE